MSTTSAIFTPAPLSVGYDGRAIVENINLDEAAGTMVGLIGANGAGKSTLLRTLVGAQKAVSGDVVYAGNKPLSAMTVREIARTVAIVYTDRANAGGLTARQVVSLGRYPHLSFLGIMRSDDKRAVDQALEAVGIQDMAHRYLSQMSDGERQKVMIARALAQDTPVVILDEPTTFLDVRSRLETFHLLDTLARQRGKLVIVSSHDISSTLKVADRLWLIGADRTFTALDTARAVDSGLMDTVFAPSSGIRFNASMRDYEL